MLNFRKISTLNPEFKLVYNKHEKIIKDFSNFLKLESKSNPKNLTGKSGKSSSYTNYLIALFIIITESEEYSNLNLVNTSFVTLLSDLLLDHSFKIYNKKEKGFPSATIKSYLRFVNSKILEFDDMQDQTESDLYLYEENLVNNYIAKAEPVGNYLESYTQRPTRSQSAKKIALVRSDWKCECNKNHETFINRYNNKQYLEGHHLIPIGQQYQFTYSLDIPANIIILCPNCHRKIHHGESNEVKNMLAKLYEQRKDELDECKISIDMDTLFSFYAL